MIRTYYIVYTLIKNERNTYPLFTTCAKIGDEYFRINYLDAYFKKEGGITDEKVEPHAAFTINSPDWENVFRLSFRS